MMKSQSGVGLIEIMIAILLFGMGLSLAMRTLPQSSVATTRGRNITKSTNLAQEKIEELMSIPYDDANLSAGTHNDPDNPIDRHFTRSWEVVVDAPVVSMKTVTVTVSYPTSSADSSVTLQTFLTSRR